MSKKKVILIFVLFAAALTIMLLLPFALFKIKDYSVLNRTQFQEVASISDDFFSMEPLSTAESLALLCNDSADSDNDVVLIDSTEAYSDAQRERIYYNTCEEIAEMQAMDAFPKIDLSDFDMVKFSVSTYIDLSDTRRYVKVAYIVGMNESSFFEVTVDMTTNQIYYYSINDPMLHKKAEISQLLECFVDYLGINGQIQNEAYEFDTDSESLDEAYEFDTDSESLDDAYDMPYGSIWYITDDKTNIHLMCIYSYEEISIVIFTPEFDTKMMSN